ncbi:MAG: HEAT repeat domain-containing protein [Planctomycetes bacterium]|nr:HEAT repeat domain-containing protein [Planctomycetota bacterium]
MAMRPWGFGWRLAAAAVALSAAGCSSGDPDSARIEGYRRDGNVESLAQEVLSSDTADARKAVRALGTLGPQALPRIDEALRDNRIEVRQEAALAYGQAARGEPVRRLASVVREDPSPEVRAAAATALGGAQAVDEMQTLLAALEDPDRTVRARANAAIARMIGRRYETYIDGTPEQRREAVEKLRQAWPSMEQGMRDYYKTQRGAGAPPKGGRPGAGR